MVLGMAQGPALPTYQTAARVLEHDKGSGWKLAGYTLARTLMIAPPMMLIGVEPKKAFIGATLASGLMSVFVLLRMYDARATNLHGLRCPPGMKGSGCLSQRALSGTKRAATSRRPTRRR